MLLFLYFLYFLAFIRGMFLSNKDELFYKKDEEDEFYPGWESSFVSKDAHLRWR